MIVIVKESGLLTIFYALFIIDPTCRIWNEELGFLNVGAMDLVHFPAVPISVQTACIFDGWIDIAHVLKAPKTSAHSLLNGEYFYLSST